MSKKLIIVTILVLVTCFIGIFYLRSLKESSTTPLPTVPTPTPVPAPINDILKYTNYQFSPLQKTGVLQTTDSEVAQLPNLLEKDATGSSETEYQFQSVNPLIPDSVITKNGVVIFERTSTFTTDGGLPKISDIENVLGKPEETIDSNVFYGVVASSLLYPTKGITIIGNLSTDETYEIQHYTPMSLATYKSAYGQYVQTTPVDNE